MLSSLTYLSLGEFEETRDDPALRLEFLRNPKLMPLLRDIWLASDSFGAAPADFVPDVYDKHPYLRSIAGPRKLKWNPTRQ